MSATDNAFHYVIRGDVKNLEIALDQGADIRAEDEMGFTFLMHAARGGVNDAKREWRGYQQCTKLLIAKRIRC